MATARWKPKESGAARDRNRIRTLDEFRLARVWYLHSIGLTTGDYEFGIVCIAMVGILMTRAAILSMDFLDDYGCPSSSAGEVELHPPVL
jgi:hypothetical protein